MRVACRAGRRRATRPGGVCRALAVAGLVLGAAGIGWADTPRRILLLYPESFYRPAVVAFDTTFRFKVRARYPGMVYFDMEKVGPRVCTDAAAYEAFQTLLKIQYAQTPPDIIVASVPEMFGSFANRARTLFPEAAGMLLGVIPEARMAFTGDTNICKIVWDTDARLTIEMALRLHPDTERVVVLYGCSPMDKAYSEKMLRDIAVFRDRIQIEALTGLSLAEYESRVASLAPRSIILYGTLDQDRTGQRMIPREVLKRLDALSSAPIYSPYSTYLGNGSVGGYIVTFEDVADMAADMALRLLAGTSPSAIEPRYASEKGQYMVDWAVLKRWGVSPDLLPEGTVVLNEPQSIWRAHRVVVLEFLLALAFLLAFVIALLWQRHRLLTARALLRRDRGELERSQDELRRLAGILIDNEEADRSRLARELHDDFSQRLAALAFGLAQVEQTLEQAPTGTRAALKTQQQALAELARELHGITHRLHPAILDDLGLDRAIESLCQAISQRYGLPVHFFRNNIPKKLSPGVTLCLYRIAQEALFNAARHARAPEVRVFLSGHADQIELVVEDEGVGFDTGAPHAGIGLTSMRERMRLVGGEMTIFSEPGEGTTLRVRIPVAGEAQDETTTAAGR